MDQVNQTLDSRRIVRDTEARIAAASSAALSSAKPFVEFQTSIMRLWANNCELLARNVERNFETVLGMTGGTDREQHQ